MRKVELTYERLRELLDYDPTTGVFRWKVSRSNIRAGAVAGHTRLDGYQDIAVEGRLYLAHRLAWFYATGSWPIGQIDHVNLKKGDNSLANLRQATRSQNNANRRAWSCHGKGVVYRNDNKLRPFQAQLRRNGRKYSLGFFKTPEEAHAAYVEAACEHHGDFARSM